MRQLVRQEPYLPPVDPIQPNRQPKATPPNSDPVRDDRRNGGGSGGGKQREKEPEPEPEEDQDPDSHLDADSFARRKGPKNLDALFSDKMPWEQEEEETRRRVEALRQQRMKNQGIRPGATKPLGLPSKASLPPAATPKPPLGPVGPQGRQVDGTFDHTAAVNSTMAAWQTLRDRQVAEQRQADEREELRQPHKRANTGPIIGRGQRFDPPPIDPVDPAGPAADRLAPERITPEPAAGAPNARKPGPPPKVRLPNEAAPMPELFPQEEPPARPGARGPLAGRKEPPAPLRPQDPAARGQAPGRPANPGPQGRAPEPGTSKLAPGTSQLGGQQPAARGNDPGARGPSAGARAQDAATRGQEPQARGQEPAARAKEPPKPIMPKDAPAPSWLAGAQPEPEAPAPVLDFNELVAPPSPPPPAPPPPAELVKVVPEAAKSGPNNAPTVKPSASRAGFTYQVIDSVTNQPMRGARLELEPVQDDLLPVLNGVADLDGWWTDASVPPGEYRITVRHPGYVPSFQLRSLRAGEVDNASIYMGKP